MNPELELAERELARRRHQSDLCEARERCSEQLDAILADGPTARDRVDALECSARRFRLCAGSIAAVLVAVAGLNLSARAGDEARGVFSTLIARSATLDTLTLRGPLRIVDTAGKVLAYLGREGEASGSGPVVLGLSATGGPEGEQTLRLATSVSGAAVSARTADGDSSIMLLARSSGPEIEMRDGPRTRVVSEERAGEALPAVAAGRASASSAIDLRSANAQAIGHGFIAVGLAIEAGAGGTTVRGRVINTDAVRHDGVKLRLVASGASAVVEIPRISPGNSTGFEATLKGVQPDALGRGRLEYLTSTVTYQAHSTRGHRAELAPATN